MELISTTKTYHHKWKVIVNDKVTEEYTTIITHYDGTDINTIRIVTKNLHGDYLDDELLEEYVQSEYIKYCQENGILYE